MTLAHLPRLPDIPKPTCSERTGKQSCHSTDFVLPCRPKSTSPVGHRVGVPAARSDSPKLDKPNVLHVLSAEEREILTRPSKCSCAECAGANKSTDVAIVRPELEAPVAGAYQKSAPSLLAGAAPRQKSPELSLESARPGYKDAGAIPKRFSLQLKSTPEDLLAKHPRSPQHSKSIQMITDGESVVTPRRVDLKPFVIVDTSDRRSPVFPNPHCKDLIPEVLPSALRDSSTDSNSSTPDYDHFLSKTLMQQSEPLSLQEMEVYLQRLYQPSHDAFRGAPGCGVHPAVIKSGHEHGFEGEYSLSESFSGVMPCTRARDDSLLRKKTSGSLEKSTALKNLNVDPKSSDLVMRLQSHAKMCSDKKMLSDHPISKTTNPLEKMGVRKLAGTFEQADDVMEKCDKLFPLPKPVELKWNCVASDLDSGNFRPVFTLGDTGESVENIEMLELLSAKGVKKTLVSEFKDDAKCDQGQSVAVRSLHKSVSCPSKPTLKSSCGPTASNVNSLLKTVMKKEMVAQQGTFITPSVTEVGSSNKKLIL